MTVSPFAEAAFLEQAGDLLGLPPVHAGEELDALEGGYGVAPRRAGRRLLAARLAGRDGAALEEVERPILERPFDVAARAVDLLALQSELAQGRELRRRRGRAGSPAPGGTCCSKVPPFGSERMAMRLRPALRSSTWPERSRRKWSGTTRPATTASPRPQLASIRRSSAPVTGCSVNITPATVGVEQRLDDNADARPGEQADTLAVGDGRVRVRRPPDFADGAGNIGRRMDVEHGEVLAGEARRRAVFVDGGRSDGERAAPRRRWPSPPFRSPSRRPRRRPRPGRPRAPRRAGPGGPGARRRQAPRPSTHRAMSRAPW